MNDLELARQPEVTPITPMSLIHMAVSSNADLDKLEKLMQLKREWEADEAKKAFIVAMAAFKAISIRVIKDKENKQYSREGSKAMYVSLGNLVNTVTPHLGANGLSARWDIDQTVGVKVTCIITHSLGHSESVAMVCPLDKSGAKNPIQEIKSSITYAKACTFESICGLASTDANLDDDGNGAGNSEPAHGIAEERYVEQVEWIKAARTTDELFGIHAAAHVEAQKIKDNAAMKGYLAAKNARKAELLKEAK